MELHGSLSENLRSAIKSAKRLGDHPVHGDTIAYWRALLAHARLEESQASVPDAEMEALICELESQLAARD